jgi:hypothetical protein
MDACDDVSDHHCTDIAISQPTLSSAVARDTSAVNLGLPPPCAVGLFPISTAPLHGNSIATTCAIDPHLSAHRTIVLIV